MAYKKDRFPPVPGLCKKCQDLEKNVDDLLFQDLDDLLFEAVDNGHVDCVKTCLAAGGDVNACKFNPRFCTCGYRLLEYAVEKGFDDCVALLIKAAAKVDNGCKVGAQASERCVKLFLEAGLHPHEMIESAARNGRANIVRLLIDAGADVNSDKVRKAFYSACHHTKCLKLFIAAGIDVKRNSGALIKAVESGSVKCVKLLLESGADVNVKYYTGYSVLRRAVHKLNNFWMLRKAGADVNITNQCEENFLLALRSVNRRYMNIIKTLLNEGIKINVKDKNGFNALTFYLKRLTNLESKEEKEFAMLLFVAGETIDETVAEVPDHLKPSGDISLKKICGEIIRNHLMTTSQVNLFVRVRTLPLPHLMKSYLLYDANLDELSW